MGDLRHGPRLPAGVSLLDVVTIRRKAKGNHVFVCSFELAASAAWRRRCCFFVLPSSRVLFASSSRRHAEVHCGATASAPCGGREGAFVLCLLS